MQSFAAVKSFHEFQPYGSVTAPAALKISRRALPLAERHMKRASVSFAPRDIFDSDPRQTGLDIF